MTLLPRVIVLRSLIKCLKRIHAEHIRRVRPLRVVVRQFSGAKADGKTIWQRVSRYIVVTWQAVIPPCFCAVALMVLYITFTVTNPVRGICYDHSFPTTDRQLSS